MKFCKFIRFSLLQRVCVFLLLPLFSSTVSGAEPDAKLNVVATYSILGDWVNQVAGDKVNLTVLVGRESDVHTFEPTPADAIALAEADIVFENGVELEYWLDKLYKASNSRAQRVIVSDGIVMLYAATDADTANTKKPTDCLPIKESKKPCCCSCSDETKSEVQSSRTPATTDLPKKMDSKEDHPIANVATGHHGHDHGEFDPHFWFDVNRVMVAVINIRDTLADTDPGNAAFYEEHANAYIANLVALDSWITKMVSQIPVDRRILVSNHNNLAYFAQRYQFCYLGSVLDSITTDTQDPSAQQFALLVDKIKAKHVRAVFGENIQNPVLIDQLAREAGLPKPVLLYTGALGEKGSSGDTYVDMMRYNVNAIVNALKK